MKQFQKKNKIALICIFLVFFLTNCNLTEDTECVKQRENANRCINSFVLFCAGNKARTECNGSLESTIFIGSLCKYQAPCQSTTDDVVKEQSTSSESK